MAADPDQLIILFTELLFMVAAGLVLGSFTTAVSYRVPRDIPWAFQGRRSKPAGSKDISAYRSACPQCGARLGIADLMPVLSWIFLRGRCRHCKAPIALRYPLIEAGVVFSLLAAYGVHGIGVELLFIAMAIPFLWALLVIDLEYMILPNQLVAILGSIGAVRIAYGVWTGGMSMSAASEHLAAAALYAGFIWVLGWVLTKLLKKDALGFGDVKFFAAAGIWLGLVNLAAFAMFSGILGVVFALIWRRITGHEMFPFGPALIAAFFVLLLVDGSHFLKII